MLAEVLGIYRLAICIVDYLNIKAIFTSYFSYQHDACFSCNWVWRVAYICIIKFINVCIKAHQYLCVFLHSYMHKHLIIFSFYLCMCILCRNHMPAYIHLLFPACMVIITLYKVHPRSTLWKIKCVLHAESVLRDTIWCASGVM